jgi:hypothetical protein
MPKYNIIIPTELKPRPKPHEESAAVILSKYFDSDVKFLLNTERITPDISIRGVEWESACHDNKKYAKLVA